MTKESALREVNKIVRGSVTEGTDGQFDEYRVQHIYGKKNIDLMLSELEELIEKIFEKT
jgi:hypothetical protein